MVHVSKRNLLSPKALITIGILSSLFIAILGMYTINVAPFPAFNGAIWVKDGFHYTSNDDIDYKREQLITPLETSIADSIKQATDLCSSVETGYCKTDKDEFTYKTLVKHAIPYKPAIPDRQELIGYCTWCRDQSFSPSCAVGRGACSYHGGVAAYNVPRYRTIRGEAAVKAQPAVYSYKKQTYKDSVHYRAPVTPNLNAVLGY